MRFFLVATAALALFICSVTAADADAAAAAADHSPRDTSSCSVGELTLVVPSSSVPMWQSDPLTSANNWLSALPADLTEELHSAEVASALSADEVSALPSLSAMCVPLDQKELVEQKLNEKIQFQMNQQDQTDEPAEEPTDPRYVKLKQLKQRFDTVMSHIKDKNASDADVSELSSIISELNSEFSNYPAEMQDEIRESKEKLVQFITNIRDNLKKQLARPQVMSRHIELEEQNKFDSMSTDASSTFDSLFETSQWREDFRDDRWGRRGRDHRDRRDRDHRDRRDHRDHRDRRGRDDRDRRGRDDRRDDRSNDRFDDRSSDRFDDRMNRGDQFQMNPIGGFVDQFGRIPFAAASDSAADTQPALEFSQQENLDEFTQELDLSDRESNINSESDSHLALSDSSSDTEFDSAGKFRRGGFGWGAYGLGGFKHRLEGYGAGLGLGGYKLGGFALGGFPYGAGLGWRGFNKHGGFSGYRLGGFRLGGFRGKHGHGHW